MKLSVYFLFVLVVVLNITSCNKEKTKNEISIEDAVTIAKTVAVSNKYDVSKSDIEALKVKSKYEKGPIRLAAIARYFPKEKYKSLLDNEYWIVFFYPKGSLEKPNYLGGEFHVLVELHTGKVLEAFKGY